MRRRFNINSLSCAYAVVVAASLIYSSRAFGQDATNKTFFLPKSATAAAYVLGRLSNQELVAAPRGEFVYVALLQRPGLEKKYRVEALEGLAKIRNTDALTQLLIGLTIFDNKGEASQPVIEDLATVLLQSKPDELSAKRTDLVKLATESQVPLTRQLGYAAIITADKSGEEIWKTAASTPAQLADLLQAIPLIRDADLRATFYPKVELLIHQADPAEIRRAAITALPSLPGHDPENFAALAALLQAGTERDAAIAGLERIPKPQWAKADAENLIISLVAYLQSMPVDKRTEPNAVMAFQLANDLTTLLPPDKAGVVGKSLRAIGVSVFVLRTVREQMLYDKTLLVVEAGKPLTIIFNNDDAMPHNVAVVAPGAAEEVGTLAEKMPPEADSQGRLYIPQSPKILYATKLVDPGHQVRLSFTAPEAPGDYQYVCTFPGHWRRMLGTLAVVSDVDAYMATHAIATPPKVTEWKLGDLSGDIAKVDAGRDLLHGKELFTKLACITCHKLGPDGVSYGPELTDVFQRYTNNATEVLHQILEPSLIIGDRYRAYDFELKDDSEFTAMVVTNDTDKLVVQSGPSAALIREVKKSDIKTQTQRPTSLMPMGLLNTLSADDIFDLVAFLKSGGVVPAHVHHQ